MDSVSFTVAFLAGIASFLSPCVLPLVPAYITYLTGSVVAELPHSDREGERAEEGDPKGKGESKAKKQPNTPFWRAIAFVLGFSVVFIALGATATVLGKWLIRYQGALRIAAGAIIVLFGLHLSGLLPIPGLYREVRFGGKPKTGGWVGAFLLGMAFAAGWSPCVGPILSAIYIYAATGETLGQGLALLAAYSAGLAVPFLVTALSIAKFDSWFRQMSRHLAKISMASGVVMVAVGLLILTDRLGRMSAYLDFLPNF
ncbi:cytochrome c biogenesis protein CcdA [Heliobacterium gestii]|uniref:Cytochrome c biogenesis protein CcdA n=1 Tax=Heliomicrobium gestii TaxID=2699 RepID=A0A845LE16_HELGE|nr:cytochrome c biogenesis protein CcdA [Heliomicrobium gestii]MBM7867246.1 cytochrome c-type biogenesis protein [Heliomicrobium gestii]MZP43801.1 cytochrome c biogenesis protein CcdA [Heliomicrobium gestii]